jgi:hypothetical protein
VLAAFAPDVFGLDPKSYDRPNADLHGVMNAVATRTQPTCHRVTRGLRPPPFDSFVA